MPNLQLVPVSEGLLDYCFENRLYKDRYTINDKAFKELWLDKSENIKVIIVDDYIVGAAGFIPCSDGLLGYLVLTHNYKKYSKYIIKKANEIISKFKCKVKFSNHNDDKTIHKWYGLLKFHREGNYWVRGE